MWRSFFLAITLLSFTTILSLAGDPSPIIVVVPDPDTAAVVAAKVPGVRIGVLQVHADESDETINARAIALRHATYIVFDHSNETLRLQMQGVIAINMRLSSQPRYKNARPANALQYEQLANFLTPVSASRE